ncbi:S-adenosylmethionine:tRNA ribosyltransferase-isomerase [Marinilabiliaceae bacterium ANBcel2]|nr:S-adenosylmethionine:tRNA ribosyltransferase-isomerase [Marinilabiliaceae bacterium ANBcel2]
MKIPEINISEYDYILPNSKIALYPAKTRDNSKLLIYKNSKLSHTQFKNITTQLPENSLLIFNNTKVVRARLIFKKSTGAKIELFCLEPYNNIDISKAFESKNEVKWNCLIGNKKKWKSGAIYLTTIINYKDVTVKAELYRETGEEFVILFKWDKSDITFAEIMEAAGNTPLPPYLKRDAEEIDNERYQTIYSSNKGSVAAPTAGLHFTPEIIKELKKKSISTAEITLHVGAGTFKPVKSETIAEHEMHTEHFNVTTETVRKIADHNGPIIAVGTTSVRTIESLHILALKEAANKNSREIDQWDGFKYRDKDQHKNTLKEFSKLLEKEQKSGVSASTSIIITPGYKFRVIDGLITNFHQPRSTLLLLIAAFTGDKWKDIYEYALTNNFRFLSYGDSSLLLK